MSPAFSYSIAVFLIIFVAGCSVNLLRQHYIFQLIGIAFFFTYIVVNSALFVERTINVTFRQLFYRSLPSLFGMSACLICLTLGVWVFPAIRSKFKE
ncbi:hypothetical protein LY28_02592 [Ruminiclostridium sufflavum DSM 19573]|uniref:Uncharacterized protein n=1 Tax=Ruminiclostridium sufflavum DSM 19573 TaxID=1121337 RepID=A0A318XIC0_9FIRM|nr:hypothetical protein [Ruminiclostridium sufflavum]PYG86970.1 hypothetical protein LY28_02592 [Ruminiclostridium sufflavum DSM 19573]